MRVGLIGCGNISDIYLRNQPHFQNYRITAVADLVHEAARARGAEFDVGAISVDAMMARGDIDTILNLTIPSAHGPLALQAIACGKHVYQEKPLATSLADGQAVLDAAKAAGVRVACAPDTILGPSIQTARMLIAEDRIGQIITGSASMMTHGMEARHPNPDFFFKAGGGPVLDMGPYYVSTLVHLLGPVVSVEARGLIGFKERVITAPSAPRFGEAIRVETFTTLQGLLQFAAGAQIAFSFSWDVWKHNQAPMELHGALGSLRLPDPNFFGGTVELAIPGQPVEIIQTATMPFGQPNFPDATSMPGLPTEIYGTLANYRGLGLEDMAVAINEKRPHVASADTAQHVLQVLLGIVEAATDRKSVAIAAPPDQVKARLRELA
ncbi:Gfo/Idh/MocA family protein [Rhizobium laguerreae]|uniref:Gfo/Idh/MocA family oxidoreductase n=1 Tax=Rhizobium laguerreae TaxID=1076926 RepID=A0A6N9ZCA9_9HYPH|nr:Gfo/Idh/MocA family oxidoreductase [Rhizobium laguerreae]NEH90468.1 gfo/Idh/MocA family oxidoreductase [Rhizobium laguerreae]